MDPTVRIVERAPTPQEYRDLCTAVGWEHVINLAAAPASQKHFLNHVLATHQGRVIGMGRIVGDGAIYFYLHRPLRRARGTAP